MGWDEHSKLQYPCPKWDPAFVFSSREVISKSLESFAWWVSAFGQGPVAMLGNLMIWFLMEALDPAVVVLLPEESDPEVSHMGSPPCLHGWVPGKALDTKASVSYIGWHCSVSVFNIFAGKVNIVPDAVGKNNWKLCLHILSCTASYVSSSGWLYPVFSHWNKL